MVTQEIAESKTNKENDLDLSQRKVMVMNNGYQALGMISIERAVCLILLGKAYSLQDTERVIRSVSREVPIPSAIVVPTYKFIRNVRIPCNRRTVFERDGHQCVYCGSKNTLTLDHVIPRDKWRFVSKERNLPYNVSDFENLVAACRSCNEIKGNKLLSQLGWPEVHPKRPLADLKIDWDKLMAGKLTTT